MTKLEKLIVVHDVYAYMKDCNVTLQQAYNDKGVPESMRLTQEEFDNILENELLIHER